MPKALGQETARPFVKWAGGKSQILKAIRAKYPQGLGREITKFAEPFVGGGAVLFDVLNSYPMEEVYIGDLNRELIAVYATIRDRVDDLVESLRAMEERYLPASATSRKEMYYESRARFNQLKAQSHDNPELSALFIFLNRVCFNGLYRVNSKGDFNVPHGSYERPRICDANNLRAGSRVLQGANIVCGDYRLARKFIDQKTFVYFDPPYRPLSVTANFTSYAREGFSDQEQAELAAFVDEAMALGAQVVASNSDPQNVDENDRFFDRLYANCSITRVKALRSINSLGFSRGRVNELLITNPS
jgi:DNA adenine methylase